MRSFRVPLVCALFVLLTATMAWAQLSTAQLSGRITDDSGAVLPGVTVTATQTDTGLVRTAVSDETGTYVLLNLPPGPYRLEATLQGFRTYSQTGIVLQVGATPAINVTLAVGSLEETVSVEAAAPLVDVQSAGIGDVVDNERIVGLPLQGRQVTDLIVLAGAAVKTDSDEAVINDTRYVRGGVRISVAGGLPTGIAYLLDGASHNDPMNSKNLPMPFPDALQEFRVATSGLSAQNGVHGAASVNAVTKSGTNRFHGNAFEFLRDARLNATSPFASVGPDGKRQDDGLKRNQFGGTAGGPLMRDRLFFFGGYQGTPIRVRPSNFIRFVPTAQMLAGDFTAAASPACTGGRQINLGAGFAGNRIDPALYSPAALKLASMLPVSTDPCGQVTYAASNNSDEGQGIGRIDYQMTPNHTIFGRYIRTTFSTDPPYQGAGDTLLKATANGQTSGGGVTNLTHSLTLGDTMVLGPSAVNAIRVAYNNTAVERFNTKTFQPSDLGIKAYQYLDNQMPFEVRGAFLFPAGAAQSEFLNSFYQVTDDFTLVRGRHQLGFGATVSRTSGSTLTTSVGTGQWTVDGSASGLALADFLLGRVSMLVYGSPSRFPSHAWYTGVYAQDSWRASDRVTVNLGLRWEPYFGVTGENNSISIFDIDKFRQGVRSQVFVNAPAGILYPGDEGYPPGQTGLNKQWLNFSPRAGIAWDMTGDGRMALRASYALTYDFLTADFQQINANAPPFGNRTTLTAVRMDDPWASFPGGDPHPITTNRNTPFQPFGQFGPMDPDINSLRMQNWNVTLERQIGTDWGVAVSYLGNYADRLWAQTALNPGIFMGLGPCTLKNGVTYPVCSTNANLNFRRALYQENQAQGGLIGQLDLVDDTGWQTYRGLKLSAQRRAATGLSVSGNYTLSRCVGTDVATTFNQASSGYTKPDDPSFDEGYCDQDRTHLATLTLGAQSPDVSGPFGALVSRWSASGILNARSGNRINVMSDVDYAMTGIRNQRPNQISDDVYLKTLNSWFNPAAFAAPAFGTYGNVKRNAYVGPNYWSVDLAVARTLSLVGTQQLELRFETFNLFNNFNWGDPATGVGSGGNDARVNLATFGRILKQAGEPRVIQLGVKYAF